MAFHTSETTSYAAAVVAAAATPTANNNHTQSNSSSNHGATLTAVILSTYDLPVRDPPAFVSVTVCGQTVKTGPPAQRHKDRNSFKFNHERVVIPHAALADLYHATARIQVVYAGSAHRSQTLQAEYPLHQLNIHETVWLILQLENVTATTAAVGVGGVEASDSGSVHDNDDDVPPTLRLQLTLSGPYRTEIAVLVDWLGAWFRTVDRYEMWWHETVLPKLPDVTKFDMKYILIPAAPILAILVVSLPIVIGVVTVTLPIALPVLVVLGGLLAGLLAVAAFLYASTATGRGAVAAVLQPVAHTLLSTTAGQCLVYQTGPRPTPVLACRAVLPDGAWGRLVISLLIDAAGSASYLLPVVGEGLDVAWAPIQTVLIMALYDRTSPNLKYISFVEEILPFTDILPSATIGWLVQFGLPLLLQTSAGSSSSSSSTELLLSTKATIATTTNTDRETLLRLPTAPELAAAR